MALRVAKQRMRVEEERERENGGGEGAKVYGEMCAKCSSSSASQDHLYACEECKEHFSYLEADEKYSRAAFGYLRRLTFYASSSTPSSNSGDDEERMDEDGTIDDRLANPPSSISRKLITSSIFKFIYSFHKTYVAFLN